MAQPLAVEGAVQFDERLLGRADSDFFTPRTSVSVLTRTQRSTLPSLPLSSGICQCEGTSTISAAGKRASTSRPRAESRAAGSAYTVRTSSRRVGEGTGAVGTADGEGAAATSVDSAPAG